MPENQNHIADLQSIGFTGGTRPSLELAPARLTPKNVGDNGYDDTDEDHCRNWDVDLHVGTIDDYITGKAADGKPG